MPAPAAEEMRIFTEARKHLRSSVFDVERWKAIAGDKWPQVVYVLNHGGRFEDYARGYEQGVLPESGETTINLFGLDTTQASHPTARWSTSTSRRRSTPRTP